MEEVLKEQLKVMRRRRLYDGAQTIRDMDGNVLLEGRVDPSDYYAKFGVPADLSGKTVLVLGCGAGAVCFDMVWRGASKVYGIEKDPQLIEGHAEICEIIKPSSPILVIKADLNNVEIMTVGGRSAEDFPLKFDYVFCLTLLENVQFPAQLMKWIGGVTAECAYFEIIDGKQKDPPGKGPVNSWRPVKDVFVGVAKDLGGFGEVVDVGEGKAKGRSLYVASVPNRNNVVSKIQVEVERKPEPVKDSVSSPAPLIEVRKEGMIRSGATFVHVETLESVLCETEKRYEVARDKRVDAVDLPEMDEPVTGIADIVPGELSGEAFSEEAPVEESSQDTVAGEDDGTVTTAAQPRKKLKKRGDK